MEFSQLLSTVLCYVYAPPCMDAPELLFTNKFKEGISFSRQVSSCHPPPFAHR